MRNLMKLIVITAMTALLLCAVITCASADEKIYTSPVFKLPKDKLEAFMDTMAEKDEPEESEGNDETGELPDEFDEDAFDDEDGFEDLDDAGEVVGESIKAPRQVIIRSSQGDVVTEGDEIYLTSELKGFDGLEPIYQWQVDRGDGLGWVDVQGATGASYRFIASRETIKYSWRLIVNVVNDD